MSTDFQQLFRPSNLRRTWTQLRRELRDTIARDVIDWTDWALTIEAAIDGISEAVLSGTYEPSRPTRFEVGKLKGAFRVMTALNVRDALVYRHICDRALELALPNKVPGAYYSRRHSKTPVGRLMDGFSDPSEGFYSIWLRYNEYRTRVLLNEPYEVLVTTDITNYFDSIQHDLLFEYLAPLGLPRQAVGLLGRLTEAFRPTSGHSPSPRVGLPVDELECSRELAHVFLFEHDKRIVRDHGEGDYVRWMDDQNIGARSMAEARVIVNAITRSLSEQRLVVNSGKTLFLTPDEVVAHFHLDANEEINQWWDKADKKGAPISPAHKLELEDLWGSISAGAPAESGCWDKVLKRFYAAAALAEKDFLEGRALDDLVRFPHLAERIFGYFAGRDAGDSLVSLFERYAESGENLFEDVESRFFDALASLNPNDETTARILNLARQFAAGRYAHQTGRPLGRANAIVALYWFGEPGPALCDLFTETDAHVIPKEVARAWLACTFALDNGCWDKALDVMFGHPSDDVLRLTRFVQGLRDGRIATLGNYKKLRRNWPFRAQFYDTRTWLLLDMAACSPNPLLRTRLREDFGHFERHMSRLSEKAVAVRVRARLGIVAGGRRSRGTPSGSEGTRSEAR